MTDPRTDPLDTRAALVRAALSLFGQKGFEAASTREISALAKTNIASIAYHFGGKEGLRLACAELIVDRIATLALPVLSSAPSVPPRRQLEAMITVMVRFLTGDPAAEPVVSFVLREMAEPSAALDRIYAGVMLPVHKRLCAIWAAETGTDPDAEATKLAVFAMLGQVLYFRIGRPVILRRMGWDQIGPDEAARVTRLLIANLHAQLDAAKGSHQ